MAIKKPVDKPVIKCHVCGDTCLVPRMYVEPSCGAYEGKQRVKCPKCCKEKK